MKSGRHLLRISTLFASMIIRKLFKNNPRIFIVLCDNLKSNYFRNRLLDHRIIISVDGPDENILKLKPPMCVTKENAEFVLAKLFSVFDNLSLK